MNTLTFKTSKKREVVDITNEINEVLREILPAGGEGQGVAYIFVAHTTAALSTADLDPGGTAEDYLDAFAKIIPEMQFRHPHDPSHMPDHILSTLIGTSITVPVADGQFVLGQWQRVVLIELDGPRERQVIVSFASLL